MNEINIEIENSTETVTENLETATPLTIAEAIATLPEITEAEVMEETTAEVEPEVIAAIDMEAEVNREDQTELEAEVEQEMELDGVEGDFDPETEMEVETIFTSAPVSTDPTFADLGVAPKLVAQLNEAGITLPTPIQQAAIPIAVTGRDLIGIAQTGTGKTLAFALPMVTRFGEDDRGVVLAPTRELAEQIAVGLQKIGLHPALLIGGAPMGRQISQLRGRCNLIVATPGRLMDHLMQGTVGLGKVSTVVLDEADRMLDMGFAPIIKRILDLTPENRQTLLFSATMPKEIEELALSHMRNPARVEIAPQGTASELVEQEVAYVTHDDKRDVLEKLLGDNNGPALVFTRTRHGARKLAVVVREMGHHAGELHSDRTLAQRQSAMEGFRTGYHRVLVATDIAARGIDVKAISLIVNWDVPEHAEDYVHRIGRTGRAGATGKAVTLVLREQAREVRDIEKLLGTEIPISDLSTVSAPVFHAPRQGGNRAAGNRGGAAPARRQRRPDRAPGARPAAANSFSDAVDRMPVREDSFPGRERPVIPAREQNRDDRPYTPRAVDAPRPEGQQNWQDRANGPRPGYNRPESNRPDGDRPYGDRSNDRPAYGDRGNQARPYGDRPAYGDRNQARPYNNDRSGNDRPYGNRPQNDRPYNDRPASDRPYNDRSNGNDRPYNARPQENRGPGGYQGNRPYNQGGNQGGGYPGSSYKGNNYQSGGNQPYGRPNNDRPYNDRPNNDRPNYGRGNDRPFGGNQGDRPSFPRPENSKPEFPRAESGAPRPSTRVTGKPGFKKGAGKPVQASTPVNPATPRPDHDSGNASPKKSHRGWSGKPGKS